MKGHEKEFNDAIEYLKSKGIVANLNGLDYQQSDIYQYDWDDNTFHEKSKQFLLNLWNKIYLNSYGKDYSFIEIILKLNRITSSKLENYNIYNEFKAKKFDLTTLENLTKLLLKKNNDRKKATSDNPMNNRELLQYLINCDVFFDEGRFYRYDGKRFSYVNPISNIFGNDLKYFSPSAINGKALMFSKNLTNGQGIIKDWMDYDLKKKRMKETSVDYEEIQALINTFE